MQTAFVANDALQCGFCTPGMIMSITAELNRNPAASLDEIKHAVAGNICRCGTYPHVFKAALGGREKRAVQTFEGRGLMGRQVTVKLGFAGDVRDVTLVIPDDDPIPWQWGEQFSVVGKEVARVDGPLKATGGARYSYDIQMPGMIYGAILRSPYAHAR